MLTQGANPSVDNQWHCERLLTLDNRVVCHFGVTSLPDPAFFYDSRVAMSFPIQKTTPSARAIGSLAIVAGCLLLVFSSGCRVEAPPEPTAPDSTASDTPVSTDSASAKSAVVTLEIFQPAGEDGAATTDSETAYYRNTFAVSDDTTLEAVMRKIKDPVVVITGSGETAFVKSIDGVTPSSSRGWTFTIDDKFSNVGIGSVKLSPAQTVRWRFTSLDEVTQ